MVIDPGDPGEAILDAIEAEVAAAGGRIVAIALTHVDPGHAAGSEELRSRTGASILCGPGGAAALSWAVTEIGEAEIRVPGATAAPRLAVVRVLRTPGHRPDHLSFLLADGTLVAGDAMVDGPPLVLPAGGRSWRPGASLARLADLAARGQIRRVIPGHGPVVDVGAVPALRPG